MNFSDFYFQRWETVKADIARFQKKTEQDILAAYHYYHAMYVSDSAKDYPKDAAWVADVVLEQDVPTEQKEGWSAILTEAGEFGDECLSRVKQKKDMAEHPPSSVCCGAKRKHVERMMQQAREVISSFKDGTAITDKIDNDNKDETH